MLKSVSIYLDSAFYIKTKQEFFRPLNNMTAIRNLIFPYLLGAFQLFFRYITRNVIKTLSYLSLITAKRFENTLSGA